MFAEILIAIALGVASGTFTGLTPGIHINLLSVMLVSVSPLFLEYTNPLVLAVFIISMSVTHSFIDSIPSIFLGAPESDTALGVLPGHRMLLQGHGLMAVKFTLIGSFGAILLSVIFFPLFLPIVKYGYPLIESYIAYLLITTVIFMILRDRKKFWAIFTFLSTGILGLIVLNTPNLSNPLFPMLSGLFGISTLIISINSKQNIPLQTCTDKTDIDKNITTKALVSGQFSGFLTAVLPGLGASTAAIISMQVTRNLGNGGFLILIGSINTVNFILSLTTLYLLDKARNGSIIAIQQLLGNTTLNSLIIYLGASLVAGCLGVFVVIKLGKIFAEKITKLNYMKIVLAVISFITVLVFILSGLTGFLILIVSTALGLIAPITQITRTHAMGCILLPVIMFFLF
ncbi:MAG: tripartite tricarboxylate transporter permease [Nanoarchaeota archaeon]